MSNELILSKDAFETDYIDQFKSQTLSYTSMKAETEVEKKALFNLMNSPQDRLSDMIGKTINVQHIYIEIVELEKKDDSGNAVLENGKPVIQKAPRIVLIDKDGKGYQCVSVGILGAIKKLQSLYGPMPWDKGIKLAVKQINKGNRRILTLEL